MNLERDLNEQQYAAVTHGEGPQLVLAGAGSGKTRVITYRVAWLIQELGTDPRSVVAVTFTNKAAGEMSERIERLLDRFPLPTWVGTFHRYALRLLRRHSDLAGVPRDFTIFDRDDQIALVKRALAAEGLAETSFQPRSMLAAIGAAKNRLLDPEAFGRTAESFYEQRVARVYSSYQAMLVKAGGVDFDDMLRLAVKLLTDNRELARRQRRSISHLLVDEFQDTNHAQMQLVLELVGSDGNLTAVGDEDQGIYRWRGADLDNVLEFERYFPAATIRKLERNYRSTQNILAAAGGLVARNQRRRGKSLWTDAGAGEPVELYLARDEQDEAEWVVRSLRHASGAHPWSDMAILVRTNAQTRAFEEELLRRRVPYSLVGGVRFYERAEIKDLVAYLRLVRNPQDDHSLSRVLNQPPRGIGRTTRDELVRRARAAGNTLWDTLGHLDAASLPARSARALRAFRDLVESLRRAAAELPLPALLDRLLEETDYAGLYDKPTPENEAKLENIREFVSAVQEFTEREERRTGVDDDVMSAFLDHASLVSDVDQWQRQRGVALMTLHSAKGLEFPLVAVAGLEDGLLPHFNSQNGLDDIEEERRLLYVGMTRAREQLVLTCCRRRRIAGRYQDQDASPFLEEIPPEVLTTTESPQLFASERTAGVYSFFDRPLPRAARPAADGDGRPLRRGRRVRHAELGDGVVLGVEGSGEQQKATVFFDRAGKRKLVLRYANLELL